MAVCLAAILLSSCQAAHAPSRRPEDARELARYALVVEQHSDGKVAHAWIPLKEFELSRFQRSLSTAHAGRHIVRVSSPALNAYCDGRHDQCVKDCLKSSRPFVIGHRKYMSSQAQPWSVARGWWCPTNCLEAAVECKKGRGEWAEEYAAGFDEVDPAIDWIKKHRAELAVGAVVVIAGVAFAVIAVGTGGVALALVPVLIVTDASRGEGLSIPLAGVCR
jgi:hypothetical protein